MCEILVGGKKISVLVILDQHLCGGVEGGRVVSAVGAVVAVAPAARRRRDVARGHGRAVACQRVVQQTRIRRVILKQQILYTN
jgi:hypothetical protein